ncbi:hypothetical protein ONZ51_g6707 [Trametes cubensis]|uniref:Uncharacterized protein n=1 Tax=Trametes cubensis TaxID=1111947 RepID=A0AAD7TU76_9APHY|nr:hypothetical protein ONZ51_g6707 [Trametes cubensis]
MPLSNPEKTRCRAALDILATKTLYFDWSEQWASIHDGNTSQLGGLKPGSREDSKAPKLRWVGLFNAGSNKRIQPPPLVQASFAAGTVPTTAEVVEALRAQVDAA